jgi:GMP synthase (glutamine-hydrolysing)
MENVKILIIDCGSNFIKKAEEYFTKEKIFFSKIKVEELNSENIEGYSHIIISGAPQLLTEVDTTLYLEKVNLLIKSALPMLGICFGHQIIGMCFGAKISRGTERRGDEEIEILNPSKLFTNITTKVIIQQEAHLEEITLPKEFKLLATSKRTKNEAMKHQGKPIWGTQFHPEISGEVGQKIIKNFLEATQHQ